MLLDAGFESKEATKKAGKEFEQHQNAADCAGKCTCCSNAVSNLAWPQGIPFTYVLRARSEDRKRLIEHYRSEFRNRWSELKDSGAEPMHEASTDLQERASDEFAQNYLRMSQAERDVASLVGQNMGQQPSVNFVLEHPDDANAVQQNQDQYQNDTIESKGVGNVTRVSNPLEDVGLSGTANDLVLPPLRGQRGRPKKRKRGRPAKEKRSNLI